MKGISVPDREHIARYCGGANVHEDGSIDGAAFRLRQRQDKSWEEYLSVNWLEYLDPADRAEQLIKLRATFHGKGFDLRPSARFAVLKAGDLRNHVRQESPDKRDLKVLHKPQPNDPSHCGFLGSNRMMTWYQI